MMSKEHFNYLKKRKREKVLVRFIQISIFILFILIWEILARTNTINTFISSSPSKIINTIVLLHKTSNLYHHILTTFNETIISFILTLLISFTIASLMWFNKIFSKVIDPYLTIINSLPKVALGPILIIWIGANKSSIIIMALLISVIVSIITIYNGFNNVSKYYIKLLHTFKASKKEIFINVIIPSSIPSLISALKLNISMCLIGIIMGEFLVSKSGIGYLIMYGSQVFNLNLVITGIFILCIFSYILYYGVNLIERIVLKRK